MVRKGSPVRVRQRALEKAPLKRGFSLPEVVGRRAPRPEGEHEGNMVSLFGARAMEVKPPVGSAWEPAAGFPATDSFLRDLLQLPMDMGVHLKSLVDVECEIARGGVGCGTDQAVRTGLGTRHADYDSAALWLYSAVCRGWGTRKGTCLSRHCSSGSLSSGVVGSGGADGREQLRASASVRASTGSSAISRP